MESLDARGLLCPLPVIRTQDRVKTLAPGTELEIIATDPGALHDIPAWCRVHGHEIIDDGSPTDQKEEYESAPEQPPATTRAKFGKEYRIRLRVLDV